MHNDLEKTKEGYYKYTKITSPEELKNFYEEYFPKENSEKTHDIYKTSYPDYEMTYMNNEFEKIYFIDKKFNSKEKKSFLDIGSGEGYALKFFEQKGYDIIGLDFSGYACEIHNKDVSNKVKIGDFYESMDKLINEGKTFDLIICTNVLEHVLWVNKLLEKAFTLLNNNGLFIIKVPNDFSILQKYLLDKKYIENQYWVSIPDHLNYFSLDSLKNLGNSLGFKILDYYSDFPIDINLLNENTNYIENKQLGKSCAKSRMELENLMCDVSLEKTLNLGKNFAELGLGRNISIVYSKGN